MSIKGFRVEYAEPGTDVMAMYVSDLESELKSPLDADDPRIHHGVWRFRVSYWSTDVEPADAGNPDAELMGTPSPWAMYHHGPPTAAPTGLTAYNAGPDARRLVWDAMDELTYELRYTADATDDDAWTDWAGAMSGETATGLTMGATYTFELRGLGATRAGVGDLFGPTATLDEMMPVPTPTLSEWGTLSLGMLLMAGGMYYTRRRMTVPQLTA